MLALFGFFGALLAGFAADMAMTRDQGAQDGPDEGQPDDQSETDAAPGLSTSESSVDSSPLAYAEAYSSFEPESAPVETTHDSSDSPPPPARDLVLTGDDDANILKGERGDDSIAGGAGDDHMDGDAGDDLLQGEDGDDHIRGGTGSDTIYGGDGRDVADGEDGDDVIFGGDGDDRLAGHEGNDTLSGDEGDDTLLGGAGNDVLEGGPGNDWLAGGDGDDVLRGGPGQDTLDGNAGNDTIWGFHPDAPQDEADFLNGGEGDDVLMIGAGDHAHGGTGADIFTLGDWIDAGRFATIADFDSAEDVIIVVYDPAAHPAPLITVQMMEGTNDATVLLDGMPLALVVNGAGIDPSGIRLVSSSQVTAQVAA